MRPPDLHGTGEESGWNSESRIRTVRERGGECGHELEDWLEAEQEILKSPPAEFIDNGKAYELQIALPGFDSKDIEVTATSDEIIVHAASKHEKNSESGKILWSEFTSREMFRRIPAPTPINAGATTARLDRGLLLITAPKGAAPEKQLVAVKAA